MSIAAFCPHRITRYAYTGSKNAYGENQYTTTPQVLQCRIERNTSEVYNSSGQIVTAAARIIFPFVIAIDTRDKIVLPPESPIDLDTVHIISTHTYTRMQAPAHTVIHVR